MILVAKKIAYLVVMLIIISVISFFVVHLAPNSFFASGELNPNITPEATQHLKELYGLEKPLFEQFINWIYSILQLDFGISFASGESVKNEILKRLPITIMINLVSMFLIFIIAFYLGIKSALNQNSRFDKFTTQLSLLSFSMPSFYLALLLIIFLGVWFPLFPISGLHSSNDLKSYDYFFDTVWHLVLPVCVIVFGGIGSLILYIRSLCIEILKSDYVFFAKARGLNKKQILRYYILPNLYPPIITILGLSLPSIIGGSVILESIFSIDGMGLLFFQAALSHDYPVIMGILIIGSFLTLLGNIIADLILIKINPNSI